MPGDTVTLEVKGRRSGTVRSTAVTFVEVNGARYLVAPRGLTEWVRNVRAANGAASLRHGKRQQVRLEEVPTDQSAAIVQAYLKKTALVTKREFGIEPDAPIADFEKIAPSHPVFKVTPV
jgi:deazaflavin-dependent oxidoreductase (nitroreductase family)